MVLKFVPVRVTVEPTTPVEGVRRSICGARMVNVPLLTVLPVAFVTVIFPVVASDLTLTCIVVGPAETIAALPVEPENLTVGVDVNALPLIVIMSPETPLVGVKLLMTGSAANALEKQAT